MGACSRTEEHYGGTLDHPCLDETSGWTGRAYGVGDGLVDADEAARGRGEADQDGGGRQRIRPYEGHRHDPRPWT